jgi:hypothetical protein
VSLQVNSPSSKDPKAFWTRGIWWWGQSFTRCNKPIRSWSYLKGSSLSHPCNKLRTATTSISFKEAFFLSLKQQQCEDSINRNSSRVVLCRLQRGGTFISQEDRFSQQAQVMLTFWQEQIWNSNSLFLRKWTKLPLLLLMESPQVKPLVIYLFAWRLPMQLQPLKGHTMRNLQCKAEAFSSVLGVLTTIWTSWNMEFWV